ncbi:UNVERIFIED_CONTAM: hypothetical protein Sradi_1869400 [Sesamum radiatum]|uniref:Uncharacterized protein n=1 Tax=Sesamum radiatum TaxID=300843 RepID=A0AAW2TYH0_SESRA
MQCDDCIPPKSMVESQLGEMKWVNSFTAICLKIMISGTDWKELKPDTSKILQNLREIQKTVQDYRHRLIHMPMKIETLNQKMNEIIKILLDLHKGLTDLKTEVADLKRNQRDNLETSKFRQERVRDALGTIPLLHQKGKTVEIPKPKTRDERIHEGISAIK